jgi:hypothetical protein
MIIKIDVPDYIVAELGDTHGYTNKECENIFKTFLIGEIADDYGDFATSFTIWLENQTVSSMNEIKTGQQL